MKSNISTALCFGCTTGAFGLFLTRGLVAASLRELMPEQVNRNRLKSLGDIDFEQMSYPMQSGC
jgi:hypothetical protein